MADSFDHMTTNQTRDALGGLLVIVLFATMLSSA